MGEKAFMCPHHCNSRLTCTRLYGAVWIANKDYADILAHKTFHAHIALGLGCNAATYD